MRETRDDRLPVTAWLGSHTKRPRAHPSHALCAAEAKKEKLRKLKEKAKAKKAARAAEKEAATGARAVANKSTHEQADELWDFILKHKTVHLSDLELDALKLKGARSLPSIWFVWRNFRSSPTLLCASQPSTSSQYTTTCECPAQKMMRGARRLGLGNTRWTRGVSSGPRP